MSPLHLPDNSDREQALAAWRSAVREVVVTLQHEMARLSKICEHCPAQLHSAELAHLKETLNRHQTWLEDIQDGMQNVDTKLITVTAGVGQLKQAHETVEQLLDELDSDVVSVDTIDKLEHSLAALNDDLLRLSDKKSDRRSRATIISALVMGITSILVTLISLIFSWVQNPQDETLRKTIHEIVEELLKSKGM